MQDESNGGGTDRWELFLFYASVIISCLLFWGGVLYLCFN